MILKRLQLNTTLGMPTNCYIVVDEDTKEAIVIDPGGEVEKIIDMIKIIGTKVKYIYLTHCHGDHIGVAENLRKYTNAKVLIYITESESLNNTDINLLDYIGMEPIYLEADSRVQDNDLIHIGNIEFKVIHTPGHTCGSTSLYCEKYNMLFSGDTIFSGTWGRTDLPTGSLKDMMNSITKKILTLPDDTIIYPGHGRLTMIQDEKPIYLELKPKLF